MKILEIDKSTYRNHLNKTIIAFVVIFAGLSLLYGQLLIALLSTPNENHFTLNLIGVVLAFISCAAILNHLKNKPFFNEIYYVWRLKKQLNSIYRKAKKLKQAAKAGDKAAQTVLYFYYTGVIQQYKLDDNTITINSVYKEFDELKALIAEFNFEISLDDYTEQLMKKTLSS
jgi:cytochrome b subunit of formate dehydrogenase